MDIPQLLAINQLFVYSLYLLSLKESVFLDKSCFNKRRVQFYKKLLNKNFFIYSAEAEGCIVNDLKSFVSLGTQKNVPLLQSDIPLWGLGHR